MTRKALSLVVLMMSLALAAAAADVKSKTEAKVQFVTVEPGVKLEVLDWGGTGRPLIFLAGIGDTAHAFDSFAPQFTADHHVYGITRRGFPPSSVPTPDFMDYNGNYSANRLGNDVLAVMDTLKIYRPVLVGHSIAGTELSSIGTRYPERVSGLIYLDALYFWAYYNRKLPNVAVLFRIDDAVLNRNLARAMIRRIDQSILRQLLQEISQTDLPNVTQDLQAWQADAAQAPTYQPESNVQLPRTVTPSDAIWGGEERYTTELKTPVLAIFTAPGGPRGEESKAQGDDFQATNPSARIVRIPNAGHDVFRSNEAEVVREMNAFFASLH